MQYTKMLQDSLNLPDNTPTCLDVLNIKERKTKFGLTFGACALLIKCNSMTLRNRFALDPKPVFLQIGDWMLRLSTRNVTWPEDPNDKRIVRLRRQPTSATAKDQTSDVD